MNRRGRFPLVSACKRFWRSPTESGPMPSGMNSMNLRSCWLPEIERRLRIRTFGGTRLHPPVNPNPAADDTVGSRGRSFTGGHPSAMRRDVSLSAASAVSLYPGAAVHDNAFSIADSRIPTDFGHSRTDCSGKQPRHFARIQREKSGRGWRALPRLPILGRT